MFHRHQHDHRGRRHARGSFGFGGRHLGERRGEHRGRGGHGMRGGRIFDHGDLRYVLLQLIAEKPCHGYELIKAIEDKLGGMYSPSPGVIYPTLTLLEELGYLQSETAGGTKKLYSITEEGTAFLTANRAVVDAIFARVAAASEAYGDGPAPEILRAMQNLTMAVRVRLGKGRLSTEQVRAVADALDRVASEIERG